jgi:hypothetical protein
MPLIPLPYLEPGFKAYPDLKGETPTWKFTYTNWRDEEHTYVVQVEGIEYTARGDDSETPRWMLHGVNTWRDGVPRKERRSFELLKIEDVEDMT